MAAWPSCGLLPTGSLICPSRANNETQPALSCAAQSFGDWATWARRAAGSKDWTPAFAGVTRAAGVTTASEDIRDYDLAPGRIVREFLAIPLVGLERARHEVAGGDQEDHHAGQAPGHQRE